MRLLIARVSLAAAICATPSAAQLLPAGVVGASVEGNTYRAKIDLSGFTADLIVEFEDAIGLSTDSLGLGVEVIDPLDIDLLSRLPVPDLNTIPSAFPLMVTIEPPSSGPLSFAGVAQVEIHTENLIFSPNSRLRLYAAHLTGPFVDITDELALGSYRVRGKKGSFSQFLIATENKYIWYTNQKYDALQDFMDTNASLVSEPQVIVDLQQHLDDSRAEFDLRNWQGAINAIVAFHDLVADNSGEVIPDVWRSSGDLVNVAGGLRAIASNIRFTLSFHKNRLQ